MKSFALAALALANAAQAQNLFDSIFLGVDDILHEVTDSAGPAAAGLYNDIA